MGALGLNHCEPLSPLVTISHIKCWSLVHAHANVNYECMIVQFQFHPENSPPTYVTPLFCFDTPYVYAAFLTIHAMPIEYSRNLMKWIGNLFWVKTISLVCVSLYGHHWLHSNRTRININPLMFEIRRRLHQTTLFRDCWY